MKLSTDHVFICKTFGLEEGLQLYKDVGFDNIDYAFLVYDTKAPQFDENYREQMRYVKSLLKDIGLGCDQTHSPIPVSYGPQILRYGQKLDISNPRFADMVRTLESTSLIGATRSVFHGLATPQGGSYKQYMDFNYAYFKALEPYAKEYGVKIGIENLEQISGNMYKVDWQEELLDRLDSDQFYALVDLGHAAASELPPEEHLRRIKRGRVQGLHFHDFNTQEAHVVPGLGESDWDKVAAALAEIGYEGNLTLEVATHKLFPKNIMKEAFKFTAESGKTFVRKFEKAKEELKKNAK